MSYTVAGRPYSKGLAFYGVINHSYRFHLKSTKQLRVCPHMFFSVTFASPRCSLPQTILSRHPKCSVEALLCSILSGFLCDASCFRLFAYLLPFSAIPLLFSLFCGQVVPLYFMQSTILNQMLFDINL